MRFQVITLFPALIEILREDGVIGQSLQSGLLELQLVNPRDFTSDKHRSVDDRPFGGGDGMLMMAEPLEQAYQSLPDHGHAIYLSPKGRKLDDAYVQKLAKHNTLTLICGRYAGIDQRFLDSHPEIEELSIGDFVLSGGELAANVLIDAVSRFHEGVLGHQSSAQQDSITMGWLEAPAYTRPREWQGQVVPEILLSGHHEKMEEWKLFVGGLQTFLRRPELLRLPAMAKRKLERWKAFARALSAEEKKAWGLSALSEVEIENFIQYLSSPKGLKGAEDE